MTRQLTSIGELEESNEALLKQGSKLQFQHEAGTYLLVQNLRQILGANSVRGWYIYRKYM